MSLSTNASTHSASIVPLSIKFGSTLPVLSNSNTLSSCNDGVSIAFVTVQFHVSQSIRSLAQAPLISVHTVPVEVLVTVIALLLRLLPLVITKWSVLRVTVSSQLVAVLIADWTVDATSSISVSPVKSIASILYAVQSIVILKLPSVTAAHTEKSLSALAQPVNKADVYRK